MAWRLVGTSKDGANLDRLEVFGLSLLVHENKSKHGISKRPDCLLFECDRVRGQLWFKETKGGKPYFFGTVDGRPFQLYKTADGWEAFVTDKMSRMQFGTPEPKRLPPPVMRGLAEIRKLQEKMKAKSWLGNRINCPYLLEFTSSETQP
jgi:hypothetical protein